MFNSYALYVPIYMELKKHRTLHACMQVTDGKWKIFKPHT